MRTNYMMTVDDVMEELGVKRSKAYSILKQLKIIRNYPVRKKYYRGLRTDIIDFYACWGKILVERLVQDDIRMQAELEAKKQKEQMPKKIGDRIQWARERSEEHNAQIKKNKAKYRGMEL